MSPFLLMGVARNLGLLIVVFAQVVGGVNGVVVLEASVVPTNSFSREHNLGYLVVQVLHGTGEHVHLLAHLLRVVLEKSHLNQLLLHPAKHLHGQSHVHMDHAPVIGLNSINHLTLLPLFPKNYLAE